MSAQEGHEERAGLTAFLVKHELSFS